MYGVRHAIRDLALGLGGAAMLFAIVFFIFLILGAVSTGSPYLGLVTVIFLPLLFIIGGITLGVGWLIGRRMKGS
ncbi:MAG: hypothetical protein HY669_04285 [Chloroflexi bacterium]|nr:hypothetical protein [Chloroflexota bacterium]